MHPAPLIQPSGTTAIVDIAVAGLVDEQPIASARARLCRRLDLGCTMPISQTVASDASGWLTLEVAIGFDGYVEITATDRVPGLYVFSPPVSGNRTISSLPLARASEIAQFAALGGRPVVEGLGHVMLGAYDCQRQAASGVRLSSSDAGDTTTPFYVVGKLPSLTAAGTDSSGRGGIINLRPGPVNVTGALGDGRSLGTLSVVVRANAVTYTSLVPGAQ